MESAKEDTKVDKSLQQPTKAPLAFAELEPYIIPSVRPSGATMRQQKANRHSNTPDSKSPTSERKSTKRSLLSPQSERSTSLQGGTRSARKLESSWFAPRPKDTKESKETTELRALQKLMDEGLTPAPIPSEIPEHASYSKTLRHREAVLQDFLRAATFNRIDRLQHYLTVYCLDLGILALSSLPLELGSLASIASLLSGFPVQSEFQYAWKTLL